ncbi:GAF domain-containing protein [Bacteroidales bacterium]|nr:GAF domain-containing protein [Bacteroidales bacterium]
MPSLSFNKLRTDDGLANNVCNGIYQDKAGYIWISTLGGLCRYDGYNIKNYRPDPENRYALPISTLESLVEDEHGNFWIGSRGAGLIFFETNTDRFYQFAHDPNNSNSITSNFIGSVFVDSKNRIWASYDQGVSYADINEFHSTSNLSFKKLHINKNKENPNITTSGFEQVFEDSHGSIWIVSRNLVLRIFDTDKGFEQEMFVTNGTCILEKDNAIWFRNNQGIYKGTYSKTGELKIKNYPVSIKNNQHYRRLYNITKFCFDKNNTLWAGTSKGLVTAELDEKQGLFTVTSLSKPDFYNVNSISSFDINEMMADNNNVIWIATRDGINYYDRMKKQFGHVKQGIEPGALYFTKPRAISEDPKGNLWVTGQFAPDGISYLPKNTDNGLYNTFKNSKDESSIFTGTHFGNINAISHLKNKDGNVVTYLFNYGRLVYSNPVQEHPDSINFISYQIENHPRQIVITNYIDNDKNLWHGYYNNGIAKYILNDMGYPDTLYHFLHDPKDPMSLPNDIVFNIKHLRNGDFWVATGGGIAKLIPNPQKDHDYSFECYYNIKGDSTSLGHSFVYEIFEASDGTIWFGTNGGGLSKLLPGKKGQRATFKTYTTKHGLPSNTIRGIMEDDNGNLWMPTGYGASKFNPITGKIKNYTKDDGLQDNEFSDLTYCKRKNGQFLMGGPNGFNHFYPDSIKDNPYAPTVFITNLKINNKNALIGKKYGKRVILPEPIHRLKDMVVSYKERVLEFEFSCNHYAQPQNNTYQYKLHPVDKEWITTDASKRFATYIDLKGGNYTFMLKAVNMDGIEGDPIELDLKVIPPFWKTLIFRIAIILLIIYGTYRFIKYREKEDKEQKDFLERKVKEGESLISEKMAEVKIQEESMRKRDADEHDMRYMNVGITKFSEIISKNKDSLEQLSQSIIHELIDYLDADQGIIYIVGSSDEGDDVLKIRGVFNGDSEKLKQKHFLISEGVVGACFKESDMQIIDNLPASYTEITSGLGAAHPKYLLAIPIVLDELNEGVLEITSFEKIELYKIDFLKKLMESIASTVNAIKQNAKIEQILIESRKDTEELRAKEDEMRQNLEETELIREQIKEKQGLLETVARISQTQEKTILHLQDDIQLHIQESISMVKQFPFPASWKGIDLKYKACNDEFAVMIGLRSAKDIAGKTDANLPKRKSNAEIYKEKDLQTIEKKLKRTDIFETVNVKKNKKTKYDYIQKPLKDKSGNVLGLLDFYIIQNEND